MILRTISLLRNSESHGSIFCYNSIFSTSVRGRGDRALLSRPISIESLTPVGPPLPLLSSSASSRRARVGRRARARALRNRKCRAFLYATSIRGNNRARGVGYKHNNNIVVWVPVSGIRGATGPRCDLEEAVVMVVKSVCVPSRRDVE